MYMFGGVNGYDGGGQMMHCSCEGSDLWTKRVLEVASSRCTLALDGCCNKAPELKL